MNKKKPIPNNIAELEDSLVYIRPQQDGCRAEEPTKIVFSFPPGPNMSEFKLICMRMAHSLGYPQSAIDEHFGPECEMEEMCELPNDLTRSYKQIDEN